MTIFMSKLAALSLVLASYIYSPAMAEDKAAASSRPLVQISPIFGQLVLFSVPAGFRPAFEQTNPNGTQYIREAVPAGETVDQWSQMITVTGAKGLAANPNVTPQRLAGQIAASFKQACPTTFSAKEVGATKISGQDAFALIAGCATAPSGNPKHSETALLIAIKGSADYYTVQWAERGPASSQPLVASDEIWAERFKTLGPKVCPRIPGEAQPYPSCINQK